MTAIVAHTDRNEFVAFHGSTDWLAAWTAAEKLEADYRGTLHNGHTIFVSAMPDYVRSQTDLDAWRIANPGQSCNYVGQPN